MSNSPIIVQRLTVAGAMPIVGTETVINYEVYDTTKYRPLTIEYKVGGVVQVTSTFTYRSATSDDVTNVVNT